MLVIPTEYDDKLQIPPNLLGHSYTTAKTCCYWFKIFPRFWLVKTTRIIHHNQLLFTKFGKDLRHIESMTSKVQPAANYWTDGVKMTSKVQPAAWLLNRWPRKPGDEIVLFFVSRKKQRAKWWNSSKSGKYFEWIIKQLLNSAFVGYGEFCRSRRMVSTSVFGLCG